MKKLILFIIAAPIISSLLILIHIFYLFSQPYNGKDINFSIGQGEGFSSINYRLYKAGTISNKRIFHHYAKYKNALNKFKAGTYVIKSGDTMPDVLDNLVNGVPLMESITIPEGKNIYEIGKLLEQRGITSYKSFVEMAKNQDFIKTLDIPNLEQIPQTVEGYLFPETYKFTTQSSDKLIIRTMVNLFKKRTEQLDFSKVKLSKHQVITLASIVEKETGAKFERPIIAGVFLNRLKKRMRLQSDPTTIYGIYEDFNGNLQKKHLLDKTLYNTYKINGLPIGPIANPSLAAITAVLEPDKHSFYYFVSHNDGTHEFTSTYKDHLNAVKTFQQSVSNRAGKSWRNLNQ